MDYRAREEKGKGRSTWSLDCRWNIESGWGWSHRQLHVANFVVTQQLRLRLTPNQRAVLYVYVQIMCTTVDKLGLANLSEPT